MNTETGKATEVDRFGKKMENKHIFKDRTNVYGRSGVPYIRKIVYKIGKKNE